MGLREDLVCSLAEWFVNAMIENAPTAIQKRAIVPCLSGQDVFVQAPSHTGKSTACVISALQMLDLGNTATQAVLLVPNFIHAKRIRLLFNRFGEDMGVKVVCCTNQQAGEPPSQELRDGAHVVIGTPAHVFDLINSHSLDVAGVQQLILNYVDVLLEHHRCQYYEEFRDDKEMIYDIFRLLPDTTQAIFLSTSVPPRVLEMSKRFMRDPIRILPKKEERAHVMGGKHFYIDVEREEWKFDTLCDLFESLTITLSVIFVNTTRRAHWLTEKMHEREFTVSSAHGDMPEQELDVVMREFRNGSSRVLIAIDFFAPAIDVSHVSLVINYDLPTKYTKCEDYIRRTGCISRFGREVVAINFTTAEDQRTLQDIEQFYNTQIEKMPLNVADLI